MRTLDELPKRLKRAALKHQALMPWQMITKYDEHIDYIGYRKVS